MSQAADVRPTVYSLRRGDHCDRGFCLPICFITVQVGRARCLACCELQLTYLRTNALVQFHMMRSCEVSSDCLRNQIHPYGVALATPTRLSITGDQSATTYLKLACHDARSTDDHSSHLPERLMNRLDRDDTLRA